MCIIITKLALMVCVLWLFQFYMGFQLFLLFPLFLFHAFVVGVAAFFDVASLWPLLEYDVALVIPRCDHCQLFWLA